MIRRISLAELSETTKIPVDVWEAMERNDFSRWPKGIYARAYIREYAQAIGVDPEATVDEFCRWFPQGDRRAERLVRGHAEIVGHRLAWQDDLAKGSAGDRRAKPLTPAASSIFDAYDVRQLRFMAAGADMAIVIVATSAIALVSPLPFWTALAVSALTYHALSVTLLGSTPTVWAIDARRSAAGRSRRLLAEQQLQPDVKPTQIVLAERR
jgi:hypothetical protein